MHEKHQELARFHTHRKHIALMKHQEQLKKIEKHFTEFLIRHRHSQENIFRDQFKQNVITVRYRSGDFQKRKLSRDYHMRKHKQTIVDAAKNLKVGHKNCASGEILRRQERDIEKLTRSRDCHRRWTYEKRRRTTIFRSQDVCDQILQELSHKACLKDKSQKKIKDTENIVKEWLGRPSVDENKRKLNAITVKVFDTESDEGVSRSKTLLSDGTKIPRLDNTRYSSHAIIKPKRVQENHKFLPPTSDETPFSKKLMSKEFHTNILARLQTMGNTTGATQPTTNSGSSTPLLKRKAKSASSNFSVGWGQRSTNRVIGPPEYVPDLAIKKSHLHFASPMISQASSGQCEPLRCDTISEPPPSQLVFKRNSVCSIPDIKVKPYLKLRTSRQSVQLMREKMNRLVGQSSREFGQLSYATLNTRYLRLREGNIKTLENICRRVGIEPGLHAHTNPSISTVWQEMESEHEVNVSASLDHRDEQREVTAIEPTKIVSEPHIADRNVDILESIENLKIKWDEIRHKYHSFKNKSRVSVTKDSSGLPTDAHKEKAPKYQRKRSSAPASSRFPDLSPQKLSVSDNNIAKQMFPNAVHRKEIHLSHMSPRRALGDDSKKKHDYKHDLSFHTPERLQLLEIL